MEVRSTTRNTARVNHFVHDPECTSSRHSSACYVRETDLRAVTRYFGVENVGGVDYPVTDEYADSESVPQVPRKDIGARIGASVLAERVRKLVEQEHATGPSSRTAAALAAQRAEIEAYL